MIEALGPVVGSRLSRVALALGVIAASGLAGPRAPAPWYTFLPVGIALGLLIVWRRATWAEAAVTLAIALVLAALVQPSVVGHGPRGRRGRPAPIATPPSPAPAPAPG